MTAAEKRPAEKGSRATQPRGAGREERPVVVQEEVTTPRPPLQSRSQKSLAKMLLAGRNLIESHGDLDLVVISEVISTAGTSTGAFYRRFKDKDAFIASVLESAFTEIRVSVDRWVDETLVFAETPTERAESIVHFYVEMCRKNRGFFQAVLRRIAKGNQNANPMRLLNNHIRRRVIPVLSEKRQPQSQTVSEFEIEAALQMVAGTLAVTLLTDPGPLLLDEEQLETTLRTMIRRFLQLSAD